MRSGSRCPAFYGEIPPMRWGILDDDGGYFYCITYSSSATLITSEGYSLSSCNFFSLGGCDSRLIDAAMCRVYSCGPGRSTTCFRRAMCATVGFEAEFIPVLNESGSEDDCIYFYFFHDFLLSLVYTRKNRFLRFSYRIGSSPSADHEVTADIALSTIPGAWDATFYWRARPRYDRHFLCGEKFRKPVSLEVTYQNPPNGWLPSSGRRHHSTTTPPSSREDLQKKRAFRLTRIVNYPIGITFLVCYNRCMNMKQRQGHACDMPRPVVIH